MEVGVGIYFFDGFPVFLSLIYNLHQTHLPKMGTSLAEAFLTPQVAAE